MSLPLATSSSPQHVRRLYVFRNPRSAETVLPLLLLHFVLTIALSSATPFHRYEEAYTEMFNSYRAKALTNDALIAQLKSFGIVKSPRVEAAMRSVDRGKYSADPRQAYEDTPHPIGHHQTISAPHMHAMCLELLQDHLVAGATVLDVGSGSGYLTACFAAMLEGKGKVLGIERIPQLVKWSQENVQRDHPEFIEAGLLEIKQADGWKVLEGEGPFDAIHVGAAAATIPQALIEQLKPGGRMVIPVGETDQELIQVDKDKDGTIKRKTLLGVRYVPLVKEEEIV